MTVKKHFAGDGGDLDALMDQLVEALAQLLDDPADPRNSDAQRAMANLLSGDDRGIHVIERQPKK
jgi:hypothetical protein